jgi:hypothetical protein
MIVKPAPYLLVRSREEYDILCAAAKQAGIKIDQYDSKLSTFPAILLYHRGVSVLTSHTSAKSIDDFKRDLPPDSRPHYSPVNSANHFVTAVRARLAWQKQSVSA